MNLRELEYLVALAAQRNFRRAAEVCNVSQPTLSAQIRKLEEELGVALFERAPRNVILTPAGEQAVARARRVLDEITQMRAEAARHHKTGTLSLRLGVFPTLGPYLLPHVVPRFIERFPGVEMLLTEEKSGLLTRRLIDGDLDAALLALPVNDSHLTGITLFDEPFRLAVPHHHPLAAQDMVAPDSLGDLRLMLLEAGHCLRDQSLEVCRISGASEHGGFRGTSLETLRQMVVAGVGATLLPELACRGIGKSATQPDQDIGLLSFPDGRFHRRIGLFWRRSTANTWLMQETAALIGETARSLMDTAA